LTDRRPWWRRWFRRLAATIYQYHRPDGGSAERREGAAFDTLAGGLLRTFIRLNELEAALARVTRRVAALEGAGADPEQALSPSREEAPVESPVAAEPPAERAVTYTLGEAGFVEGRNVRIETRWTEGHYDRLPLLAAELVRIPMAVLAATGITAALAAKASTATIPVVFHTGGDPVEAGLVANLGRPGGNVTGVVSLGKVLLPKQFEVAHELAPKAGSIAFLVDPKNGVLQSDISSMQEAARAKGVPLQIVEAGNEREIDAAFATLFQRQPRALIIQPDPFLDNRREQIAAAAARHSVAAIAANPEFAVAGGLISYGDSLAAAYRLEGTYIARILKGEKPADMPVQQSVKVQMTVNLKTAEALGLTVPPSIVARADEVIE
jgi:putative ABC transport system substrate-binding protein